MTTPSRLRPVLAAALLFLLAAVVSAPCATAAAFGPWRWPLDGTPRVTRAFDPPDDLYGPGHRGVDLASRPGAVVRAAGAGQVAYAGVLAGRGVVTVLHARGLRTTYEPVRPTVARGQPVAPGTPIGRLVAGHPGCPVAACLHWGLLRGDTYLDPLALLGAEQVRLLPLDGDRPPPGDAGDQAETGAPSPVATTGVDSGSRAPPRAPVAVAGLIALGVGGAALRMRRGP